MLHLNQTTTDKVSVTDRHWSNYISSMFLPGKLSGLCVQIIGTDPFGLLNN